MFNIDIKAGYKKTRILCIMHIYYWSDGSKIKYDNIFPQLDCVRNEANMLMQNKIVGYVVAHINERLTSTIATKSVSLLL